MKGRIRLGTDVLRGASLAPVEVIMNGETNFENIDKQIYLQIEYKIFVPGTFAVGTSFRCGFSWFTQGTSTMKDASLNANFRFGRVK